MFGGQSNSAASMRCTGKHRSGQKHHGLQIDLARCLNCRLLHPAFCSSRTRHASAPPPPTFNMADTRSESSGKIWSTATMLSLSESIAVMKCCGRRGSGRGRVEGGECGQGEIASGGQQAAVPEHVTAPTTTTYRPSTSHPPAPSPPPLSHCWPGRGAARGRSLAWRGCPSLAGVRPWGTACCRWP